MKTKNIILSFLSLILVVLLCSYDLNKVKAEEDTWYSQAAANAGNPILLEDNQYFQGISINSNLISDLTFMEIPFNKYLITVDAKVQIIAFAEAMYRSEGKKESELVMYVYYPDMYNGDNKYIYTDINIESQKYLYENRYVNNTSDRTVYRVKWTKVSSYGNITKYSYSKYNGVGSQSTVYTNYFKKKLLNDYNSSSVNTEVQTIFSAKINKSITSSGPSFVFDDDSVYAEENFQFIYAKHTNLPEGIMTLSATEPAKEHVTVCVGTKTNTVTVTGETISFRYTMDMAKNIEFLSGKINEEEIDIKYLFFNVADDSDGKQWGTEKYITEVKLNYIVASLKRDITCKVKLFSVDKWTYTYNIEYYASNGKILKSDTDTFNFELEAGEDPGDIEKKIIDEYSKKFSNKIGDKSLYHLDVITPEEYTFEYIANSDKNEWVSYHAGFFDTRKVTYKTLFNTNSEEFKNVYDNSPNMSSHLIENYQFGLVYGSDTGYPVKYSSSMDGLTAYSTNTETLTAVAGIIDIEYKENGNIYRVSVSENNIDNSAANKPLDQDQDFWIDEEGTPRPKDDETGNWFWDLIQKILNFFVITIPKWLDDNKDVLLGVVATIGIILGASWVIKAFNTNDNEESNKEK